MPFKLSELTSTNANMIFARLDAGRGHTVERHGDLGYAQLLSRRIQEATCWIKAQDACDGLKEVLHPSYGLVDTIKQNPNAQTHVLDTADDWNKQIKIRVVEQTRGVAGAIAKEGIAMVSVLLVIRPYGQRTVPDPMFDIITMYPKLRHWIGTPKDI